MQLCAEIHRWAPGLLTKPLEASLREAQLKEVAEASEARKASGGALVPTVGLRKDRAKLAAAAAKGGAGGGPAVAAFDPTEMLEEVDLQKALKKTDYEEFKASKVRGCFAG